MEKWYYDHRDIMTLYAVGERKAYNIIRQIRFACGGGKLGAGKVTVAEHDYWAQQVDKRRVRLI